MRAALYRGAGRIELTEVEPEPPGPGEVAVRVRACGICGSDLHVFRGEAPPLPFAGGHEIAGEVVAAGDGVTGRPPGTRVAIEPIVRCDRCAYCRAGLTNLCDRFEFIGFRRHGGFAEQIRVPAEIAWPLPDSLSWPIAALTEPLAVATRAVRLGGVSGDTSVGVIGGGAVGLLCALAARELGVRRILVAARYPQQVRAAEALGVAALLTPAGASAARPLAEALGDRPDVVVEAVGGSAPDPVADAISLVRRGGVVVLTGIFTESIGLPVTRLVRKEVTLRGSYCYGRSALHSDFGTALNWLARSDVPLDDLVTHRFRLDDIQTALETASTKESGAIKVQISVTT